jgi:hypothetical protein
MYEGGATSLIPERRSPHFPDAVLTMSPTTPATCFNLKQVRLLQSRISRREGLSQAANVQLC